MMEGTSGPGQPGRSDHFLWPIRTEHKMIPKGSHTFFFQSKSGSSWFSTSDGKSFDTPVFLNSVVRAVISFNTCVLASAPKSALFFFFLSIHPSEASFSHDVISFNVSVDLHARISISEPLQHAQLITLLFPPQPWTICCSPWHWPGPVSGAAVRITWRALRTRRLQTGAGGWRSWRTPPRTSTTPPSATSANSRTKVELETQGTFWFSPRVVSGFSGNLCIPFFICVAHKQLHTSPSIPVISD